MSKSDAPTPLPADPHDGVLLENDVLGARIWGPPNRPTITLGASDVWDRRWFAERQPLVTLAQIRELAAADRLQEVAPSPNRTVYSLYNRYDFPCPKPGAQLILLTPFAETATVLRNGRDAVLEVRGGGKSLSVRVTVMVDRRLVLLDCTTEALQPGDLAVRVYRHTDTILPGQPLDPTLGDERSADDFDPLPAPSSFSLDGPAWGIVQQFPPDPTFADGFAFSVATALANADAAVEQQDGTTGLGTPLYAEQEGRLDHGVVKRYTPINDAAGAAATATLGWRATQRDLGGATHDRFAGPAGSVGLAGRVIVGPSLGAVLRLSAGGAGLPSAEADDGWLLDGFLRLAAGLSWST